MVTWRVEDRRYRFFLAAFLVASVLLAFTATPGIAAQIPLDQDDLDTITLPPGALNLTPELTSAWVNIKTSKLDSSMSSLAGLAHASDVDAAELRFTQTLKISEDLVYAQMEIDAQGLDDAVSAITAAGGEVTGVGKSDSQLQGWVPIEALEALSRESSILYIHRPHELVLLDEPVEIATSTEGLAVINGPAWHSAGHTGSGVKIGIIDGGFLGYGSLLGTELPATVTVDNFVDGETAAQVDGSTPHGTAVAEIIHDIAPDAILFFAKVNTTIDLEQAVAQMKDTHKVDIISTSIGWYNVTPGDGTGYLPSLVESARNSGILWATAAGNDRQNHWGGQYTDSDNDTAHEFDGDEINVFGPGNGQCNLLESGTQLAVFVRWNDWSNVDQDYDLLLVRWNGSSWELAATSRDAQNGSSGQRPTESVIGVTGGSAACFGIVIVRNEATQDVNFEVFAPRLPSMAKTTPERSLANLADSPDAMTVAAVDVNPPYPQEAYSAEGPTNGPGGSANGGNAKPEIAAFANVATESYGGSFFNGTSSATPHVAGAAALVLGANPAFTVDLIQEQLEQRAIDMGPSGADTYFGAGRLYLGDPPATIPVEKPDIAATPASLNVQLASDAQANRTLSISNSGTAELNWTISESQPGGSSCTGSSDLLWLAIDPISGSTAVDASTTGTVTFTSLSLAPGSHTGTLCIDSNDPDKPLVKVPVSLLVGDDLLEADLQVSVADSVDPVQRGSEIQYSVTVANAGPDSAISVVLTNSVPSTVSYVPSSSSPQCATSGDEVVCNLGILASGASKVVEVAVSTNRNTTSSVTNIVEVASSTADPDVANNTDSETTGVTTRNDVYMPQIWAPVRPPSRLEAIEDTVISQGHPTINGCNTVDMWAGFDLIFSAEVVRSLVKFDLAEIPRGTAITSATLRVRHYASGDTSQSNAQTMTAFRVGSPWSECAVDWTNQPSIGEAYGAVSVPFSTSNWYSIDVTGLVQGWVNGAFPNYGLWIRGPEDRGGSAWRGFYTSNSTYEPYLSINYPGFNAAESQHRDDAVNDGVLPDSAPMLSERFGGPRKSPLCEGSAGAMECVAFD